LSYAPTGSWNIVKILQYIEEVNFGVTPSASPVFVAAGMNVEVRENTDITAEKYRALGSMDIYKMLKTGELYSFELRYQPISSALLKYGSELPAGAGTIEKSLSFLYSQKLNAVENYIFYKGSRTDKLEIEITEAAVAVAHTFLCKEITTPNSAHGLTTPTFASLPTAAPWTGASSGSNPLTINGLNYDTPRFKVTINWNLDVVKPNGEIQAKFIEPTNRDIAVDFDAVFKDTVLLADAKTLTARAASYVLNTGVTLNLTDLYLEAYYVTNAARANRIKYASYKGTAKSCSISG
jgi:hypothetical protein